MSGYKLSQFVTMSEGQTDTQLYVGFGAIVAFNVYPC